MKATPTDGERSLAVFIDFENMGLGFNNRRDRFEIGKVLERLLGNDLALLDETLENADDVETIASALESQGEVLEIDEDGQRTIAVSHGYLTYD